MEYTVDYFIAKFTAIPHELWITGLYSTKDGLCHCVLGHCGVRGDDSNMKTEADHLNQLVYDTLGVGVVTINDADILLGRLSELGITQDNPKDRILFALNLIKEKISQVK